MDSPESIWTRERPNDQRCSVSFCNREGSRRFWSGSVNSGDKAKGPSLAVPLVFLFSAAVVLNATGGGEGGEATDHYSLLTSYNNSMFRYVLSKHSLLSALCRPALRRFFLVELFLLFDKR